MNTRPPAPSPLRVHIRWMIRRDMPEVLRLQNACYEDPADETEIVGYLRQRNCIAMVAEADGEIYGWMLYELHSRHFDLIDFAVLPSMRRRGVGRQMMQSLKAKLSPQRRTAIVADVWEHFLDAQIFLRAQGFRAE